MPCLGNSGLVPELELRAATGERAYQKDFLLPQSRKKGTDTTLTNAPRGDSTGKSIFRRIPSSIPSPASTNEAGARSERCREAGVFVTMKH